MIDSPEILRLIETVPLFRGVPREILEPILANARWLTLNQDERLLSPGTINEIVYILISGRLNVQATALPSDRPLAMLSPGDCVGEMSVLVDRIVSAYVVAATKSELLALDYASFWSLIDSSNEAARNMLNILVHRIRLGNRIMADSLVHHKGFPEIDIVDNLTGLYNYHGIQRKFNQLLVRCAHGKQPLCLIVLEVDDLERAVDTVEDLRVDQTLRTVAQTLLTFLRPDDHAARLVGKKFAVLLTDTSLEDAVATAKRLRAAINEVTILLPDGSTLPAVSISAGACQALPDDKWNVLVARADVALGQATGSRTGVATCPGT